MLGILARCLDKEDAAMTVEPFLIVVRLVEGEGTGRMYRKRGARRKEGRQGGETYEGLLRGTVREERGRYQLFCKFMGLLIPLQR